MQERKRVESRKAAYGWIKRLFGIPESTQDEITVLADALGGQFGLKDNLRAGLFPLLVFGSASARVCK